MWFLERMGERSTWMGLIGLAGVAGVNVQPEAASAIASGAVALAGVISAVTADK